MCNMKAIQIGKSLPKQAFPWLCPIIRDMGSGIFPGQGSPSPPGHGDLHRGRGPPQSRGLQRSGADLYSRVGTPASRGAHPVARGPRCEPPSLLLVVAEYPLVDSAPKGACPRDLFPYFIILCIYSCHRNTNQ